MIAAALMSVVGVGHSAAFPGDRALSVYNIHTNEQATIVFKHGDTYDRAGLEKLNRFLRDWRRELPTRMDPHLFDLIWAVYQQSGSHDYIHVVCGYRSPDTNGMLRRRSRGVARNSLHMQGKAMDFYIPDVPLATLREVGLRQQAGGVGFYPTAGSPFVHMDTGSVRHWPRMTRDQLVRVFPDGNTLHIPSDGQPLPGYDQALAAYQARQAKATSVAGLYTPGADPSIRTPFAEASANADVGDDEDAAEAAAPAPVAAKASAPAPAVTAAIDLTPAVKVASAAAVDGNSTVPMPRLAPPRPTSLKAPTFVAALTPTAPTAPTKAPLPPGKERGTIVAAAATLDPMPLTPPAQRQEVAAGTLVTPDFDFDSSRNWQPPAVPAELAKAMAARDVSKPASFPIAPTAVVATIDVTRPLTADAITTAVLRRSDDETPATPNVMAFASANEPLVVEKPHVARASAIDVPFPPANPLRAGASRPAVVVAAAARVHAPTPGLTLTSLDTQGLRIWIATQSTREQRYALLTMPDFAATPSLLDKPDTTFAAGFSRTAYSSLRTDRFAGALVEPPAMVDLSAIPVVAQR